MIKTKEKLIFIYPDLYSFVKTDINLLSSKFDIISWQQKWSKKILLPFNLKFQFLFLLLNIFRSDRILISFGGYHSFLPALLGRVFNKKVAIIVHGTDCVSFPEINYGSLRKSFMKYFITKTYQWVSIILPVSESLVYTENHYYSNQVLKFGYTYHLSNIKTPFKVIPNGVDENIWYKEKSINKLPNTFVTVLSNGKEYIKGADLICMLAKKLPDCIFYLAGIDRIKDINCPNNVVCTGRLDVQELRKLYSKSQFYLQLSNTEGFGVALCEAMLCECVPIVSAVNFLPEIVGDSGFVLAKRDLQMLEEIVKKAFNSDVNVLSKSARENIKNNFSIAQRKKHLIFELTN